MSFYAIQAFLPQEPNKERFVASVSEHNEPGVTCLNVIPTTGEYISHSVIWDHALVSLLSTHTSRPPVCTATNGSRSTERLACVAPPLPSQRPPIDFRSGDCVIVTLEPLSVTSRTQRSSLSDGHHTAEESAGRLQIRRLKLCVTATLMSV
jgi:hypothetical protein